MSKRYGFIYVDRDDRGEGTLASQETLPRFRSLKAYQIETKPKVGVRFDPVTEALHLHPTVRFAELTESTLMTLPVLAEALTNKEGCGWAHVALCHISEVRPCRSRGRRPSGTGAGWPRRIKDMPEVSRGTRDQ
ncbi:hypothetical protein [Pectobacterium betavasculorum]|uniref:Uncharacterized protein n=1 Tax=Pectobacterium betavasculorum TaxID=55207 RepID=A0ABR4V3P0_9GAMM|nr:hypothetical protein [Pectobacterium betavasculorum]KFX22159.1 hypothetical protein JV35_03080 [Pectobacterium betavasculorum]